MMFGNGQLTRTVAAMMKELYAEDPSMHPHGYSVDLLDGCSIIDVDGEHAGFAGWQEDALNDKTWIVVGMLKKFRKHWRLVLQAERELKLLFPNAAGMMSERNKGAIFIAKMAGIPFTFYED